nr:MAG: hypothetical protein [Apis mellifra filamentous-like virus]
MTLCGSSGAPSSACSRCSRLATSLEYTLTMAISRVKSRWFMSKTKRKSASMRKVAGRCRASAASPARLRVIALSRTRLLLRPLCSILLRSIDRVCAVFPPSCPVSLFSLASTRLSSLSLVDSSPVSMPRTYIPT